MAKKPLLIGIFRTKSPKINLNRNAWRDKQEAIMRSEKKQAPSNQPFFNIAIYKHITLTYDQTTKHRKLPTKGPS